MSSRIVLISGCSTGIGLSAAVLLAKDPEKRFKVYATMRNLAKKGQLEEEGKENLGDTLIIKQMDVTSDESVQRTVQEVIDNEGKIDVLVNNAGAGVAGVMETISMEMVQQLFDVNVYGAVRLIKAVLPGMKERQDGCIVNVSSVLGVVGAPFFQFYCATKFAMAGLVESMAPILHQFNIRISLVEPGPVKTSFFDSMQETMGKIDTSNADQKSRDMMQEFMTNFFGRMSSTIQEPGEIVDVIQEIILCKKPRLKYSTNKQWEDELLVPLSAHRTSDKALDILENFFFGNK